MRFLALIAAMPLVIATPPLAAADFEQFEKQVRPVLAAKCQTCHGASNQLSGLRLDSRDGVLRGGKRGAAVVPGKPGESLLIHAIRRDGLAMPPAAPLSAAEVKAIEEWVRDGAPWPSAPAAPPTQSHWAFQPVTRTNLASIDAAIHARLKQDGLQPAPPADRRTLIRRLAFTITGLPPSAAEIDAFVNDPRADAYERLVDRLLGSAHFGERWARHWMDVVRFGETHGYEWNYEIGGAWQYRDYLIRAFNNDVPYDQLVREHIAGDLIQRPRVNAREGINESIIGTAFFRLGEAGHDDCIEFREICLDVADNQIDTLSKAFQGLTLSCARCHDHKLDPIPSSEYYAVAGILASSRQVVRGIDTGVLQRQGLERLAKLKPEIRAELAKGWRENADGLWERLLEAKAEKIDDPLYPWTAFVSGEPVRAIAARYAEEIGVRAKWMRENTEVLNADWFVEGLGIGDRSAPGEFAVAPEPGLAITGIYPSGWYTHLLSEKMGGALRSSLLPKNRKFISLEALGGKLAARRTSIDNGPIGEPWEVLKSDAPHWIKTPTVNQTNLPIFVELVTKRANPRIPDRPGVIKGYKEQDLDSPRSFFGISRAVLHDVDATPKPDLGFIARLFDGDSADLGGRYVALTKAAIDAFAAGTASNEDAQWLDAMLRAGLLENRDDLTFRLGQLLAEYRKVEAAIPEPRWAAGMADNGPGFDAPVLPYGDWKNPGVKSPRRFLAAVTHSSEPWNPAGSGRLELAEAIASAANPLTARVMANRVWSHMFGRGIVETVDNFGAIGAPPTHPVLLDYLAARLVDEGWSVKKLIRAIALSETFQQSNVVAPAAREKDPRNLLLHHYPVRRLEAEPIRDALLAVAGNLDPKLYGASVHPHREEAKDYRRLFDGPLDGAGRRSIYLKVTRMEGARFLETFDFPPPLTTRGARDTTNVPAQALAMLNDPFVIGQAEVWAAKLIERRDDTLESRIQFMHLAAIGRPADEQELANFAALARQIADLRNSPDRLADSAVWKDVAHAMFNLKEFLYIR